MAAHGRAWPRMAAHGRAWPRMAAHGRNLFLDKSLNFFLLIFSITNQIVCNATFFFKKQSKTRFAISLFTLFSIFLTPTKIEAQSCSCGILSSTNIGTNSASDNTLTNWIATHPGFPVSSLSGCMRVFGTLHIDKNFKFAAATITMMPGSKIIVEPGFSLTISGSSSLQACNTAPFNRLWRGITVREGASLLINKATIKDAIIALDMQDNTTLQLQSCVFDKNVKGVFFAGDSTDPDNSGYINLVGGSVRNCSFNCSGVLLKNENNQTVANRSQFGIDLHNCDYFNVGVNAFPTTNVNKFSNQQICIYAEDCEALGIFNTTMTNSSTSNSLIGTGVWTSKCVNAIMNFNKFTTIENGIFQTLSDLSMSENTITADKVGVACGLVKNRMVHIFGQNSISGKEFGILIKEASSSGLPNIIEIAGNKLLNGNLAAIAVASCTAPLWIHDNLDIQAVINDGIGLTNCSGKGMIRNNIIKAPGRAGINLQNVNGYQFVQNTVNGGYSAVQAFMTENNLFCCTSANDCSDAGMVFTTSCTDTRLWNSNYSGNAIGLVVGETAMLKPQENRGNNWFTNNSLDALYFGNDDPSGLIQFNIFRISMPFKPTGNSKTIVTGGMQNPDNWHKIFGTDPSCSVPTGGNPSTYCNENANIQFLQSPWDEFSTISPVDSKAIQTETGLNNELSCLKWLQRQYLYKKTKYNTSFRNSDASLSSFYTVNQNAVLGKLEAIESGYRNLFLIPASNLTQYESLRAQSLTVLSSIAQIDLLLEDTTGNMNNSLQSQRLNLVQSAIALNVQIQQIEASAKLTQYAQAASLLSNNFAISTSNAWETNEKTVFGILLQTNAMDVAISASQQNIIEGIAAQCPTVGGRGVAWARAIKKSWNSTPDDNACFSVSNLAAQFVQNREKTEIHNQNSFQVFPSPTNYGYFNFEIPKLLANGGDLQLIDISGVNVLTQKIPEKLTTTQIDVSLLSSGMYFYLYKGIDGMIHSGKIVIQNN